MHSSNLLPKEHARLYKLHVALLYVRRFLVVQILFLSLVLSILAVEQLFYREKLADLESAAANLKNSNQQFNVASLQEVADKQNAQVKAASAILKNRPAMSGILEEMLSVLPSGVTVDSVKIETAPIRMDLIGRAASRDDIVLLQSRLEKSDILKISFAPLSNLTESEDAPFYFVLSFDIKAIQGND